MQNNDRIAAAVAELAAAIAERSAPNESPDRLMNIPEAAQRLGIGRTKAYDLIGAGHLRTLHVGRRVLVPSSAVEAFIARHGSQDAA